MAVNDALRVVAPEAAGSSPVAHPNSRLQNIKGAGSSRTPFLHGPVKVEPEPRWQKIRPQSAAPPGATCYFILEEHDPNRVN